MNKELFSCKQCGICCFGETTVSLDPTDQENMLTVLGVSREVAMEKYWRLQDGQIQMKTVNGHCIFYNDGCTVYTGRPWRCRQWPFVNAIVSDIDNFHIIKNSCQGFSETAKYELICEYIREKGVVDEI